MKKFLLKDQIRIIIDAILIHLFGMPYSTISKTTMDFKATKGLWGNARAYVAVIEATGTGLLHAHVLLWSFLRLYISFSVPEVESHKESVVKSQEMYSGETEITDEDFCAAIAQRLQLRNVKSEAKENLSSRPWNEIKSDQILIKDVDLMK